jgi:exodeoxyribonuclease VII small subunit
MSNEAGMPPRQGSVTGAASGAGAPTPQGTFEEAIRRLSDIVQALEKGDLPLEDSLRLFEEGVRLSRSAQEKLDGAQKRVEQLLSFDEQGRPRTKPFETTGDDPDR